MIRLEHIKYGGGRRGTSAARLIARALDRRDFAS